MSIQALREQLSALALKAKALVEGSKDKKWTPENQAEYDGLMEQIDGVKGNIQRLTSVLDLERDDLITNQIGEAIARNAKDAKAPALAIFDKWLRGGDSAVSAEDWASIRNTMSTTTPSQGGYSVPTEVASRLIDSLKAFGGMRECATVIKTSDGAPMSFPTSDGTSETGEIIAENTTATAADPSFGTASLNTFKFSSKVVAVPFELLQDSAIDMEAFISGRLATRVFRITNNKFTVGAGTTEPDGVIARASSGKVGTTGQTVTVIYDDLIDLIHSVDPAYRALGKCRFMMNDSSLKVIRKLKDTAGRPIYLPGYDGLGGKMPDTLLGYPVTINQDVAVMAANAKSIAFGDFSFYTIRDAMEATLFRFTDSAYAKLGQVGFLQWSRHGGNLLDTAAVKYYQNSAT